jgi:hypothetical protein
VTDTEQTWSIHIPRPNRKFRTPLKFTRYHILLFQKSGVRQNIDLRNSKKRVNEKTVRSSLLSSMKSPHKGALCTMVLRPSIYSLHHNCKHRIFRKSSKFFWNASSVRASEIIFMSDSYDSDSFSSSQIEPPYAAMVIFKLIEEMSEFISPLNLFPPLFPSFD